jgi:hypothetical protein
MVSRVRESEIAHFYRDDSQHPIPLLRFHMVGDDAFDAEAVLRHCAVIMLSFKETELPEKITTTTEIEESFVVSCFGPRTEPTSDEEKPWLEVGASFTRTEAEAFRHCISTAGFWWFLFRYNDADAFISFTVDAEGNIISRHIFSERGTITTLLEGRTYH